MKPHILRAHKKIDDKAFPDGTMSKAEFVHEKI